MTPAWFRAPLTYQSSGPVVALVERKLGLEVTGVYSAELAAAIRGLQRARKLEQTGEVDEETAAALGPAAAEGLLPEWFVRPLRSSDAGEDVAALELRLGIKPTGLFTPFVGAAVRRFQSSHGLVPTGVVTEAEAHLLGE